MTGTGLLFAPKRCELHTKSESTVFPHTNPGRPVSCTILGVSAAGAQRDKMVLKLGS